MIDEPEGEPMNTTNEPVCKEHGHTCDCHAKSMADLINGAKNIAEIDELLSRSLTFKKASPKTVRKWNLIAKHRKACIDQES